MSLYLGPAPGQTKRIVLYGARKGNGPSYRSGWLLTGDAKLRNLSRRREWLQMYNAVSNFLGVLMLPQSWERG